MKMRKNLLAMLLAVVMIAAVVFIAAPATKAADANIIEAQEKNTLKINEETKEETVEAVIELTADSIVNLNGLKNVVIDTKGYKVSLIDTGNLDDLSGDAAGTAKVTGTGTVADWVQHTGGFKYLALENADGTYSAHPFNITIDKYGVNTHYSAVSIRVTVIANDKVAALIDAGEFGMHNYSLKDHKDPEKAAKEYSPYWKSFKDFTNEEGKYTTHGIHGYFYLENSLTSDVLTDNLFAQVGAYIKIGNLTVESNTKVDIYPKTILTDLNKKVIDEPTLFTEDQKAKMVELLNKEGNDYLKAYCGNFLPAEPVIVGPFTYDFSTYTAGTQYASETHKLDDILTMAITECHLNGELRIYSSSTHNGSVVFSSTLKMTSFTFNIGNKDDKLNIYGSDDGAEWKLLGSIDVKSSYSDITYDLPAAYKHVKLDVAGDQQLRIKSMDVTFVQTIAHTCNYSEATCAKKATCTICGLTTGDLAEHKYEAVIVAPTCGDAGYTSHTCSVCRDSYNDTPVAATGNHTTENGVCDTCGQTIGGTTTPAESFSADFNTVTANTSYTSRKTTSGWMGTNCAVTKIGDFTGFTMNGKKSAKGSIVSPTLTNGLSAITIKYGNTFSEKNGVDITITIKQNGVVVATKQIDNNSVTQNVVCEYVWENINIKGDFTIEITNNSPSNSTSNKDRVTIADFTWTNNP